MTKLRHYFWALASAVLCGCSAGTPSASTAPGRPGREKLALLPKLDVGARFVFHVDLVVGVDSSGRHDRGEMLLDDTVEVVSSSRVRERFSNVKASGEGAIGETLERIAPLLSSSSVTTHFDEHWQQDITKIDGTSDDEARTMIMNLTPVVSFRILPSGPVAISGEWAAGWNASLRSEQGAASGRVKTNVRYRLDSVATCGTHRCATIVARGSDVIPPQGETSGTSDFDARIVIDVADVVPISKTIDSRTHLHGEQDGQPLDYTNTIHVDVRRSE